MGDFAAGIVFGIGLSCAVLGVLVLRLTLSLRAARRMYEGLIAGRRESLMTWESYFASHGRGNYADSEESIGSSK